MEMNGAMELVQLFIHEVTWRDAFSSHYPRDNPRIFLFEKVEKIRQKHAVELSERSFDDATDVPPFIKP